MRNDLSEWSRRAILTSPAPLSDGPKVNFGTRRSADEINNLPRHRGTCNFFFINTESEYAYVPTIILISYICIVNDTVGYTYTLH